MQAMWLVSPCWPRARSIRPIAAVNTRSGDGKLLLLLGKNSISMDPELETRCCLLAAAKQRQGSVSHGNDRNIEGHPGEPTSTKRGGGL